MNQRFIALSMRIPDPFAVGAFWYCIQMILYKLMKETLQKSKIEDE